LAPVNQVAQAMSRIAAFIVILYTISGGCNIFDNNEIPDGGTSVEIKPLGDLVYGADLFSCNKDCYGKLAVKADTNFIINSNSAYDKLKERASCLEILNWPDIDFTKYTLLAGVIITPTSCCLIAREDLSLDPFNSVYTLTVTLQPGTNDTPGAVFFWALTARLPEDSNIVFLHKYNSIQ
jgi:hypothetical protein